LTKRAIDEKIVPNFLSYFMLLKRLGIVLAALIPVAIVGAFVFQSGDDQAVNTAPAASTSTPTAGSTATTPATELPSTTTTVTTADAVSESAKLYANGTYTAEGAYTSPMGAESITVTVTVDVGSVTAVTVVPHGTGASAVWQGKFVSGVETVVLGKDLGELNLTNVSGSSLTPIGFNAAIEAIKAQAKV
jgi:uncharacterized protein with FMN-binding domain